MTDAQLAFVVFGLATPVAIIAFFAARRWRPGGAPRMGPAVFAFAGLGLPLGVWLFLDGRSWQLRAGSLLAAGWAAHAASVEPRRPRPMRGRPVLWNMLVRCVALYLFAQVFLWWPLWDIERAAWVVFAVLFVVNTVLNIAGHLGDELSIEHA